MTRAVCTDKIRDKRNKVVGYVIKFPDGKTRSLDKNFVKQQIRAGSLELTNMRLDAQNRLVSKPDHSKLKVKLTPEIEGLIIKARTFGGSVEEFDTDCRKRGRLIRFRDTYTVLYIPDNVTTLKYEGPTYKKLDYKLQHLKGRLKVIGGSKLNSTCKMFYYCNLESIDLSQFDTSHVKDMSNMFYRCNATYINIEYLDTSAAEDMSYMFYRCGAKQLNLKNFNTSRVEFMFGMFQESAAESIDITTFDVSRLTDMCNMFKNCAATNIDLTGVNFKKQIACAEAFTGCKVRPKLTTQWLKTALLRMTLNLTQ